MTDKKNRLYQKRKSRQKKKRRDEDVFNIAQPVPKLKTTDFPITITANQIVMRNHRQAKQLADSEKSSIIFTKKTIFS